MADNEIPDYMWAADVHQVANGKPSSLEGGFDSTADFGKFTASTIARAVTSTLNTVPAVANWFGADLPEVQTDSVLRMFDDNLAAYYSENRQSIDVWGDVAAMFVPGMAGVKGINMVQKGLGAAARGEGIGANLARSFGTLPEQGSRYAKIATEEMQRTGGMFRLSDANVIKSFAANYGQAAVEGAAFEVAAAATMTNSPLFEEHDIKDVLYNAAFGGGLFGAGIIGSVTAAQTYGQLRRASNAIAKAINPMRFSAAGEQGAEDWATLLQIRYERKNVPVPDSADPAILQTQRKALDRRQRDLQLEELNVLTRMSGGDAEVASVISRSMDQMHPDAVFGSSLGLQEITRLGTIGKTEAEMLKARLAGKENEHTIKYLDIADGTLYHTPPTAIGLADSVSSVKELAKDVARRVATQPVVGKEFNPTKFNHLDVEARYIDAAKSNLQPGLAIHELDLPYLEAALEKNISVEVSGVRMDPATLRDHIKNVKTKLADDMADYIQVDPTIDAAKVAKQLNVDRKVLEGGGYPQGSDDHFFAKKPSEVGAEPDYVKVIYKTEAHMPDGNELSGMIAVKQAQKLQQVVNEQAVAAVIPEYYERLIKVSDAHVISAAPSGAGARPLAAASSEYGTLGSIAEYNGKVVSEAKLANNKLVSETFQPVMHAALNNADALNEIYVLRQAVLQTGEKYVLLDVRGTRQLKLKSVHEYDMKVAAGKRAEEPVIPAGVPLNIEIKTDEAWNFMVTLGEHNTSHLRKEKVLRNATGRGMGDYEGVVYFPQPSSKEFPYFSFVKPKNPFEGEHTQMIWARSPEELTRLEASVPYEYTILRKADTDAYFKAMKEYDADLGMTSRGVMTDLQRKGIAAPYTPKTNGQELFEEILDHYKKQGERQIRESAELYNNVAIQELRRMDSEFRGARSSKKPGTGEDVGVTPYESYIKTMLDIPRSSQLPVWTELNNLAENIVSKVVNSFKAGKMEVKSEADIAQINKGFDEAGIRGVKDALTEMIANHPADKKVLSRWVQNANALFSTLILRTDPMNALNNGVGNLVLTGSETAYLTRMIAGKGGEEGAAFLRELGEVKLPGTEAYIKSPTKLVGRAYASLFSALRGDTETLARLEKYKANGWMPDMMDQLRSSFDTLTLNGMENAGDIEGKIRNAAKHTGDFLEKATGNKLAEQINRFVAAHIADDIAQAGIKYAGLSEQESKAFINTFVNRTQGNYVASQRPLMFQGPIGQSISLFMTYQFNMLQHIFRHLSEEGGRKNAAILMGLQSSIYGMNGLPAFNLMNQHLVGQASGNKTHADIYSAGMDIPAVGEFLLYGGLSSATGLGVYSRGDLNPRHATIVPNAVGDIPVVSATTKFFQQLMKSGGEIAAGANPTSTFLRGIEHAGISRPLAGLAQVLNGVERGDENVYSTTTKGNVIYAQDMYSLATLGRVLGARPMDEAITRDAYYRVQVYEGKDKEKVHTIGAAIRDKINSKSEITDSDFQDFAEKYVASGGNQRNFIKFYQQQVKNAGQNQIGKLVERGNSSYGQYMQNLMRSIDSDPQSLEN